MNATDLQHLWCYDVTQWGSHMFCGTLPTSWMCESERTFTLKRKLRWTKPKDDTERAQQSGSLKPSHLVPRRSMLRKVATWSAQLCRMALFDWKILWSSRISVRTTLRTSCTIESSDAFKTWKKMEHESWNLNRSWWLVSTLTKRSGTPWPLPKMPLVSELQKLHKHFPKALKTAIDSSGQRTWWWIIDPCQPGPHDEGTPRIPAKTCEAMCSWRLGDWVTG